MHLLIFDPINLVSYRLVSLSIIKAPIGSDRIDGMWVVLFEHRFHSLFNFKYFINIIFHLFMRFVRPMSDKSFRLVYNSFNLCAFFSLPAKILTSESWCLLTWNKQSIIFLRSSWCFNAFDIDTFDKCWKRLKFFWANHTQIHFVGLDLRTHNVNHMINHLRIHSKTWILMMNKVFGILFVIWK